MSGEMGGSKPRGIGSPHGITHIDLGSALSQQDKASVPAQGFTHSRLGMVLCREWEQLCPGVKAEGMGM